MKNMNAKKLLALLSSAAVLAGAMPFMTTAVQAADTAAESTMLGDVNNDNKVSVADAVAILQFVANKDKFNLSAQAIDNADVYNRGDGVTARDALAIQRLDAKVISALPESVMESSATTTGTAVTTTATGTTTATTTTQARSTLTARSTTDR